MPADADLTTVDSTPADQKGAGQDVSDATDEQQPPVDQAPADKEGDQIPEKYELKADGYDEKVVSAFVELAKELKLPQEGAQKMLDKLAETVNQRDAERIEAIHEEWQKASKEDKEFGGEKFEENLSVAKAAYQKLATDELKAFMDESQIGSHPEVIRLFYRIGKQISDDNLVSGGQEVPSAEKPFYPNSNMN